MITSAHNISGGGNIFTTCERCTHMISTRDFAASQNNCAHGIILQSVIHVLKRSVLDEEVAMVNFSDEFDCWVLEQSHNNEKVIVLKKYGNVLTFLAIADHNDCLREGTTMYGLCIITTTKQGDIQVRCQNTRCKKSKSKNKAKGKRPEFMCVHLSAVMSTKVYQELVMDSVPDLREHLFIYNRNTMYNVY